MTQTLFRIALGFLVLTSGYSGFVGAEETVPPEERAAVSDPDPKELEKLDFAHGLFSRDHYEMAIDEYHEFLDAYPESPYLNEVYLGLAESLFFSKQYDAAIEVYQDYLNRFPESQRMALAQLRLGQALYFVKQYEKALEVFQSVSMEDMESEFLQTLYFYKAKVYKDKGDTKSALIEYQLTIDESDAGKYLTPSLMEVGDIYYGYTQFAKAAEYYHRAYENAPTDEIRSLALYKKGEMNFILGNYTEAVEIFKTVMDQFPQEEIANDAFANYLSSLYNDGQNDKVVESYQSKKQAVEDLTKFYKVHLIAASALARIGKAEEAFEILDRLLEKDNLDQEFYERAAVKKAEILVQNSQFSKAVDVLMPYLEQDVSEKDKILYILGEAKYGLKEYSEAFDFYQRIRNEFPDSDLSGDAIYGMAYSKYLQDKHQEAIKLFREYFTDGKDPERKRQAMYNTVVISSKHESREEAIQQCQTYLNVFKDSAFHADVQFLLGTLYSDDKQYRQAVNILKPFLETYPEHADAQEARFLLGYSYQMLGEYDPALENYAMVEQEPTQDSFYYSALKNRAMIYLETDREQESAEVFLKIIEEFPENDLDAKTYLWLADRLIKFKNYEGALMVLERSSVKGLSDDQALSARYYQAQAQRGLQQCDQAIPTYEEVINAQNNGSLAGPAWIGKGQCFLAQEKTDKAIEAFNSAIKLNPDDNTIAMKARFEIARVHQKLGNLKEASKFYMLVAILYQDPYYCSEALLQAGQIFESLQELGQAKSAYQEILKTYPDSHAMELAKERLNAVQKN